MEQETSLTPEQIELIRPVIFELEDNFFDVVGRLDEKSYFGEFKFEAYKASLSLHREHTIPQYPIYKYIRQYSLSVSNMAVEEEYNIMSHAVRFGIELISESLRSKTKA